MKKRRKKYKRSLYKHIQHKFSMLLVCFVILILSCVIGVHSYDLNNKLSKLEAKALELNEQIADAENETQRLLEYEKYMQTKAFCIEIAKERLGLIFPDEILFITED